MLEVNLLAKRSRPNSIEKRYKEGRGLYFAIEKCREMQCFLHRFASPYFSYKLVFDKAFFSR